MKKKIILSQLIFILLFTIMGFQEVEYSQYESSVNQYSIELGKYNIIKGGQTQSGGYQDLFTIIYPDSSVKYLVNIIRTKSPINYEYLKSEDYKNSFIDATTKIEEAKEIKYKSFKGIRFLKRITTPNRVFLSYTISTIVKNDLFVITYNNIESNFHNYEEEFNHSVNSIKFK